MTEQLREAYQRLGDRVPGYGEPERPIASARRARRRRVLGTPVLVVALFVGLTMAAAELPVFDRPMRTAPTPADESSVEAIDSIEEWAPPEIKNGAVQVGAPAEVGTMMYQACAVGDCEVYLLRPDRTAFKLSDVRPDLAEKIDRYGFDGATLSYDARWLGIRVGTGYEIHELARRGFVYEPEAGPTGTYWDLVDWGAGSYSAVLARYRDRRVTAYGLVDLLGGGVLVYKTPENYTRLPVSNGGNAVMDAKPVDVALPPAQRDKVTKKHHEGLVLRDDGLQGQGTRFRSGWPTNLSRFMRPGETLAGPYGVPEVAGPPEEKAGSVAMTTVFAVRNGVLVETGVVPEGARDMDDRLEVPEAVGGERWELISPITHDSIALAHTSGRVTKSKDLVQLTRTNERRILHRLPRDADILLPGMKVS